MARLLLLLSVMVAAGCHGSDVIWSAEAPSPDGKLMAQARTVARSGFGTGSIDTFVFLKWDDSAQAPVEILELTVESETPPQATAVQMKWTDPTHLELSYEGGHRAINFEAVRCGGVNIKLHEVSKSEPNHD